jgi:hypothetical protein
LGEGVFGYQSLIWAVDMEWHVCCNKGLKRESGLKETAEKIKNNEVENM